MPWSASPTSLVEDIPFNGKKTIAALCGPAIMIKGALCLFDEDGMPPERIYTTRKCG